MNFLMPILGLIALVYLTGGWIGIPESYRLTVALVMGGILGVLGTIGIIIDKKSAQGEKSPTGQFHLGRYTAGAYDNELTMAAGGRTNIFCRLAIGYVDGKDEVTARIIDVLNYSVAATPDGEIVPFYLEAFCEMRQAKRTFRADRIVECSDEDREVTDLLGILQNAPSTVVFNRKTTIIQPVSMPPITIDYQFRAPNFKRVTINPVVVGYTEQTVGKNRTKTIVFIDAIAEGKTTSQRFSIERIQGIWRTDDNQPVQDLATLLLVHAPKPMSVPNA